MFSGSTGYAGSHDRPAPAGRPHRPSVRIALQRAGLTLGAALTLAACQSPEPDTLPVTGTITWASGEPLPADAVISVQLRDVSRADAPAPLVALQEITSATTPPIAFSLAVPATGLDPRASLSIGVRITSGDRLIYISDTANPVPVTGAVEPVAVKVVPVGERSDTVPE
ncbi:MAG: YbaY family lipoprotein [Chromatiales bacterium]|nr:YbaY family lipoprotein [Chromatiales bacterium]